MGPCQKLPKWKPKHRQGNSLLVQITTIITTVDHLIEYIQGPGATANPFHIPSRITSTFSFKWTWIFWLPMHAFLGKPNLNHQRSNATWRKNCRTLTFSDLGTGTLKGEEPCPRSGTWRFSYGWKRPFGFSSRALDTALHSQSHLLYSRYVSEKASRLFLNALV